MRYTPDRAAVDGLDLEVWRGECFGLLGPNGAGKTTTVEILEGLRTPTSGAVEVLGRRWGADTTALRARIGVALQETHMLPRMTVVEALTMFVSFYEDGPDVATLLAGSELTEHRNVRYENLSGGQKQRLAFACALSGDPDLLFLDEPTNGLDPQSRRQMWSLVERYKERGRTVVLTTHYMEEAEQLCDRVAIIDRGRVIACGTSAELIAEVGGGRIEFSMAPAPSDLTALSGLPSVREARWGSDQQILLNVDHLHVAVPALVEYVAREGSALTRLTTRHVSLEDVFIHHTGRALRD
jgi:ABC-2 type transport system ATP-binding protein